ncbi:MAG: Gfo/Idh/MocA family oxidoreductase [Bdellovibrionales bacterium]|nr:Gfo/Idh/MocA family oxidoreductase [Bdellovibrionales bacterium]
MTSKPIRIGIAGTGLAGDIHVRALKQLSGAEVVGACASSQASSQKFAQKYQLENSYGSWQDLIEDVSIDVIHNCLPNTLHFEVTKAALESGKHVLADKPLAIGSEQSRQLLELAKQKQLIHGLCSNYRCLPMVRQAKAWIIEGKIGKLLYARGHYLQSYNLKALTQPWKADASMIGPSYVTADLGHHWLDLLYFLSGKHVKVARAEFDRLAHCPPSVENQAYVQLQLEDGVKAQALFSKVAAGHHNSLVIEVGGDQGMLRWDQTAQDDLVYADADGHVTTITRGTTSLAETVGLPPKHHGGWVDGFINLFESFYRGVREGQPNDQYPSFEDGHRLHCLIDALVESNAKNKAITLDGE